MKDRKKGYTEPGWLPKTYAEFRDYWHRGRDIVQQAYAEGRHSWLFATLPPDALELSVPETVGILSARHGRVIDSALAAEHCDPLLPVRELPAQLQGPLACRAGTSGGDGAATTGRLGDGAFAADTRRGPAGDGGVTTDWIRRANVVGINVRTVGGFFGVVKYLLTLPSFYNAVHLLPIWEPGVVGSLYGMSSWEINPEFFDPALAEEFPHLDTATRQLRAVTNLLHATGRSIGMDVIPHTDRFSEIAIAQPWLFEWIRREDTDIVDKRANLHEEVQERILDYVDANGPAAAGLSPARQRDGGRSGSARHTPGDADRTGIPSRDLFFGPEVPEETRNRILFGGPEDPEGRSRRRGEIVHFIHAYGYEPAPATMAPPYRGLEVDLENRSVDSEGDVWRDYKISRPESMSRVFGPLARYKLYERMDDNRDWEIDFSRPRTAVWDYVCDHYAAVQEGFGFDFMRGDMSHVQMRADGVPVGIDHYYDIHSAVKRRIQGLGGDGAPHFAYFAETFMAPRGIMAYGDEIDHLEAADAEVTLGDLQSKPVHSDEWLQRLRRYWDVAETRSVTPSFTVMTGDKDDPRFDGFYLAGSELRTFLSLFLVNLPSYTALGFELRDIHTEPAPNEYYSKLYVFQEREGPKATHGPYRFGRNGHLFHNITRIRLFAEELFGGHLRAPRPGSGPRAGSSPRAGTERAAIRDTRGDTRGTEPAGATTGKSGHPTMPNATTRPSLRAGRVRWLRAPDPTGGDQFLAWTVDSPEGPVGAGESKRPRRDPGGDGAVPAGSHAGSKDDPSDGRLLFLANTDTENPVDNFNVPWFDDVPTPEVAPELLFTTHPEAVTADRGSRASAAAARRGVRISRLEAGECRVYRMNAPS